MPIIKQAIKRVKQAKVRTARNRHYRSHMKSMIKLIVGYAQKGQIDAFKKVHADTVKAIDTCAKKNIIHRNTASRNKSRLEKLFAHLQKGGTVAASPAKKSAGKSAKKSSAKPAAKKKTAAKAKKNE